MQSQQNESNGVEQNQQSLTNHLFYEVPPGDYCALFTDPEPVLLDLFNELMI